MEKSLDTKSSLAEAGQSMPHPHQERSEVLGGDLRDEFQEWAAWDRRLLPVGHRSTRTGPVRDGRYPSLRYEDFPSPLAQSSVYIRISKPVLRECCLVWEPPAVCANLNLS